MVLDFWQTVEDFQTLISGGLAIIAAVGTTAAVVYTARLPLRAKDAERREVEARRRAYVSLALGRDLFTLAARARSAQGTIRVTIAANANITDSIRAKVMLRLPEIVTDWESMSLLPEQSFLNLSRLIRLVEDHNFDMERAGGAFGADNFREHILRRVEQIQVSAKSVGANIDLIRAEGRAGVRSQQPDGS